MARPMACLCLKALWRTRASALVFAVLLTVLSPAGAAADDNVWALLAEPRTHAIMRHALAPGTGDPSHFEVSDCSTQRNLDDRGREQARRIGDIARTAGASFDRVLSSQWCRCLDTAELLDLGNVEAFPPLNSFFRNRSQRTPQTNALRDFLATLPDDETVMMVTHQVNVSALTGTGTRSGEIIVFRLSDDGDVEVRGRIRTPVD